jgi:hypothetical protein
MKKAIQIVMKDAVHLWPRIGAFFAILIVYAVTDPTYVERNRHDPSIFILIIQILPVLLALSCWLVVVSAVQLESLIGSEQYWLTRPFGWRTLLGAKVLFIVLFVNLPVFLYQAWVLAELDFSPLTYLSVLFWRQVFFSIFMIAPAAALAVATKSLRQAIAGALIVAVLIEPTGVWAARAVNWGELQWIKTTAIGLVVLVGVCLALLLQYRRRYAAISRGVLAVTVFACMLLLQLRPWGPAYAIQARLLDTRVGDSPIRTSLDKSRSGASPDEGGYRAGTRCLEIPLRVDNGPEDARLSTNRVFVGISGAMNYWVSNGAYHENAGQGWLILFLPSAEAAHAGGQPATLHVTIWGLGRDTCPPAALFELRDRTCLSPYLPDGYAPFPTSAWLRPIEEYSPRAIAYFARTFEIHLDRLDDYLAQEAYSNPEMSLKVKFDSNAE